MKHIKALANNLFSFKQNPIDKLVGFSSVYSELMGWSIPGDKAGHIDNLNDLISRLRECMKINNAECCVYFISAADEAVKIGIGHDPFKRLKHLQGANHRKLSLSLVVCCDSRCDARQLELHLHETYKADHMIGEWFDHSVLWDFSKDFRQNVVDCTYCDFYDVYIKLFDYVDWEITDKYLAGDTPKLNNGELRIIEHVENILSNV